MHHIVAATDFSMRSQRAVRRAGRLAHQLAAELILVHVVDDDQPQAFIECERREADRFLSEQIESLAELRGLRCRAVVAAGDAFDGILKAAQDLSADLIVMGTHRKKLLRDIFVGTTIERVIRTGPFPVLMVNTSAEHSYEHVLAAIDMSEASAHAIKCVRDLGLLGAAKVTLLHAFLPAGKGKLYIANAPLDQVADYIASERRNVADELSAFLAEHRLSCEGWSCRIEEGEVVATIAQTVAETLPDLVVLGTHGRSGIVTMLLGSVAEKVLRSLEVDILAVPPAAR